MQSIGARTLPRLLLTVGMVLLSAAAAAPGAEARADQEHAGPRSKSYPGTNGTIAFVRHGQIYLIEADGSNERQVTTTGLNLAPKFGPYGHRIAYLHQRGNGSRDIWLMRRDGTHRRQVTHHGAVTAPAWSPDGRWIAFGSPMQKVRTKFPFKRHVVLKGRVAVGAPQLLQVHGWLAWSPDGRTIAYYSDQYPHSPDHYLLMYDVRSREVELFWEIGGPCCGEGYFADLNWTPDSAALGYTDGFYQPNAGPRPPPQISVYTVPDQVPLPFASKRGDAQPSFAPAGDRIVFRHHRTGPPALIVADVDGLNRRVISIGHHPDWQPLPTLEGD